MGQNHYSITILQYRRLNPVMSIYTEGKKTNTQIWWQTTVNLKKNLSLMNTKGETLCSVEPARDYICNETY